MLSSNTAASCPEYRPFKFRSNINAAIFPCIVHRRRATPLYIAWMYLRSAVPPRRALLDFPAVDGGSSAQLVNHLPSVALGHNFRLTHELTDNGLATVKRSHELKSLDGKCAVRVRASPFQLCVTTNIRYDIKARQRAVPDSRLGPVPIQGDGPAKTWTSTMKVPISHCQSGGNDTLSGRRGDLN